MMCNQKFNGLQIVKMEYYLKLRKKFLPINIIYEPLKS